MQETKQSEIYSVGNFNQNCDAKLECGSMPNVMAALSNTGGTLCSTPQTLTND